MAYYERWVASSGALKHIGKPDRTLGGRSSLVWGAYLPDATTTGHTYSSPTTTYTTKQTFNDTGAGSPAKTITNTRFNCDVEVKGKNYVFVNCEFIGPAAGGTGAIVQMRWATTDNILFEDCTFYAQTPNDLVSGPQGRGFTLSRCNIYGLVDGVDPAPADGGTRTDVVIKQCYIHDLLRYSPSSTHSDNQTHSDSIQWQGGLGLTLWGNRIEDKIDITKGTGNVTGQNGTAALMINALNNTVAPGELNMQKNWLRGGYVGINSLGADNTIRLAGAWEGAADGTVISGNRIMNDQTAGTVHRWVGRSAQTGIVDAMNAATNYTWDGTVENAFAGTVLTSPWKANSTA